MAKQSKKLLIYIYAHFLLFPFYFSFINKRIQQVVIFGSLMIYLIINIRHLFDLIRDLRNHRNWLILSGLLLCLSISATILVPILQGTNDFSYFKKIFTAILYGISYIAVIVMISKLNKEHIFSRSLKVFLVTTRNYVLSTLVFTLVPRIKKIWLNLISLKSRDLELIQSPKYKFRVGWSGYAGFTKTLYCTIAVFIAAYFLIRFYREHKKINWGLIFNLFLVLLGNAFYGRVGLVISLFSLFILMIYFIVKFKRYDVFFKLLFIGIALLLTIKGLTYVSSQVESWYNWLMEPFISLVNKGELSTSSTDALQKMWFIPDPDTFFFGDALYSSPEGSGYYMSTDVGYLRPILFYGIIFSLLNYIAIGIIIHVMSRKNKDARITGFTFMLAILIFEIKGEVIFEVLPLIVAALIASANVREEFFKKVREEKLCIRLN